MYLKNFEQYRSWTMLEIIVVTIILIQCLIASHTVLDSVFFHQVYLEDLICKWCLFVHILRSIRNRRWKNTTKDSNNSESLPFIWYCHRPLCRKYTVLNAYFVRHYAAYTRCMYWFIYSPVLFHKISEVTYKENNKIA